MGIRDGGMSDRDGGIGNGWTEGWRDEERRDEGMDERGGGMGYGWKAWRTGHK